MQFIPRDQTDDQISIPKGEEEKTKSFQVVAVEDWGELEKHVPAWEELAGAAIEPNVFYEHWMLRPALEAFGNEDRVQVVMIWEAKAGASGPGTLCGLFPLVKERSYNRLPVGAWRLWKHRHCFLCTPLLRKGYAGASLEALLEWMGAKKNSGALMEFGFVAGDGPFHHALLDYFYEHGTLWYVVNAYTRPMLRAATDADAYLREAMSGGNRRMYQRKKRRLAESGKLECRCLEPEGDVDAWIETFLQLEASGWKGREGSAMALREEDRAFFAEIAREAFGRGRLMMMEMNLDGRPIAQRCGFAAGEGAYAFKIAFDESESHYSPGMLLEIENIYYVHSRADMKWMDSCAAAGATMLERVWTERRSIENVLVPTGQGAGGFWVSVLPLLRWGHRKMLAWEGNR